MKKKIIMGCSNYWRSPFQVGSHHIARAFSRLGWEVAYVSDPISPFHFFKRRSSSFRDRLELNELRLKRVEKNIYTHVPFTWLPPHNKPILRTQYVHENWQKYTMPRLFDILKADGFRKVDLVYLDNPIHFSLLDLVKYDQSVLRIADKMSGFHKYTPAMGRLEKEAAGRVDLVAYTARSLQSHVESLNPRDLVYFPNGINLEHFMSPISDVPLEYLDIPSPRVVYVGAMHEWFDYKLLSDALRTLHEFSFVLIGPSDLARKRLPKTENLHLLGERPYETIPGYLQHADVGIIPFNVEDYRDLIEHVNPLKLFEYLAAGLPVVSTRWKELETGINGLKLSSRDGFAADIARAYKNRRSFQGLPTTELENLDWTTLTERLICEVRKSAGSSGDRH